jgi:MoxR-vWA-beta-propeller ternary system domain bpX1
VTGEVWNFRHTSARGGQFGRSRSDHQFIYWSDDPANTALVDLENRTCVQLLPHMATLAWRNETNKYAQPMQMRRRFRRIAINPTAMRIELLTGREAVASISLQHSNLVISESAEVRAAPDSIVVGMNIPANATTLGSRNLPSTDDSKYQHLAPIETGRGSELDLQRATWPDGSEAIWDQRGFLTLKSSDPNIRQCTIALRDSGPLAGWVNDGRRFGPGYFHPPGDLFQLISATQIFSSVIRPFMERIG